MFLPANWLQTMNWAVMALLASLSMMIGCSISDTSNPVVSCAEDAECPEGLACQEGLCVESMEPQLILIVTAQLQGRETHGGILADALVDGEVVDLGVTDADGEVALELPLSDVTLRLSYEGFVTGLFELTFDADTQTFLLDGEAIEAPFVLVPVRGAVTVSVTANQDWLPLSQLSLVVSLTSPNRRFEAPVEDGSATFVDVGLGQYLVQLQVPGFEVQLAFVGLTPDEPQGAVALELELESLTLSGLVVAELDLSTAQLEGVETHSLPVGCPAALPQGWECRQQPAVDGFVLLGPLADLSMADLGGADLSGSNLSEADLSGAFLGGADLRGALLVDADLRDAALLRANLSGADLSGADLSGAFLVDADLSGADLSGADLSGASFSNTTVCPDGRTHEEFPRCGFP